MSVAEPQVVHEAAAQLWSVKVLFTFRLPKQVIQPSLTQLGKEAWLSLRATHERNKAYVGELYIKLMLEESTQLKEQYNPPHYPFCKTYILLLNKKCIVAEMLTTNLYLSDTNFSLAVSLGSLFQCLNVNHNFPPYRLRFSPSFKAPVKVILQYLYFFHGLQYNIYIYISLYGWLVIIRLPIKPKPSQDRMHACLLVPKI